MTHKKFFAMMVRGSEIVVAFLLFGPDCSACDAKLLIRGIASYKDRATEQEYFRFVRLNLVVLFQRLTNQRRLNVAEYIYREFLPPPDRQNLDLLESLFEARRKAKERVWGGWRPGRG